LVLDKTAVCDYLRYYNVSNNKVEKMKGIIAAIVAVLAKVIIEVIGKIRPRHKEGYSDGTTEKDLRDKAKKDGWDV
jgi:hypothetical protein